MTKLFDYIKFDNLGLVPCIVCDYSSGEVVMLAFMDKEAINLTVEKKMMHYFSRSRQKIWQKGEESGSIQILKSLKIDCDGDSLLAIVEQKKVACHTGRESCFFYDIGDDLTLSENQKVKIDPKELYLKND